MPLTPQELEQYVSWGVPPPTTEAHGTAETIRGNLKPLKTRNWRMKGNMLIADTDEGELAQTIPTDYICTGTDENGLPILKKVVL